MADKVQNEVKPTAVLELANGDVFEFTVTREAYIKFTNNVQPTKKYPAQFNFLTETVKDTQRAKLVAILDQHPQVTIEFFGLVFEAYEPDLGLVVKKRNGEQID